MNNRKILAVLVAGSCAAPLLASAQENSVVIYGRLYPQFTSISTSGATQVGTAVSTLVAAPTAATAVELPSHNEVQASNSRLGFRGTENLGGGWQAFFQVESTIPLDAGGGTFGSRDTFVGIMGPWGSVKLGNMDTVYKNLGDQLSFLGVSSGNFVSNSNVLSKQGFGTSSSGSFHLRRANSIQFESPEMGPVTLLAQYSPDEAKSATRNATLWSYGFRYGGGKGKKGGLTVALAAERHNDLFGGSNNVPAALSNAAVTTAHSKDTAIRGTVSYGFNEGKTTVEVNMANIKYLESGGTVGRFESYKHTTYSVALEHNVAAWQIAASYVHSAAGTCSLIGGANCDTSGLDGSMVALGTRYNFSKRTSLFAMWARVTNGTSARYNNLATGSPNTGSDITQLAGGIQHSF